MVLEPFEGVVPLRTHHCVTGSIRHIYAFHGHDLSEEMLLGLGEGVGFMYWHARGQAPFLGGRANPKPGMEELAGQRTGVHIRAHTTLSLRKARQDLLGFLEIGLPVMLQVDMGFLPYFDFNGEEYHFGGHVVVACGYDPKNDEILLADRDGFHPVPWKDLEQARSSIFKPFPPRNAWWTFDFSSFRSTTPAEIKQAISDQAAAMLTPPIRNFGIRGIRLAAERIPGWSSAMTGKAIRQALFNTYIFISPVGGSGGGLFRFMFSRFLQEAAVLIGDERLNSSAKTFTRIGDEWESFAAWARQVSEVPEPAGRLAECTPRLLALADLEQTAWEALSD